MSGQSFSMWAEICKKEILSTQLGISAAVEGCLLENLLFKQDVSASQYIANMVWRRRECTRCTALHLDRPYLIIHVGCVMSKLRTSRSEKKN